jgi:hypothetical protein
MDEDFNILGTFRKSDLTWTKTAKECYLIGCRCDQCNLPRLLESEGKCRMKPVVLELVRRYGKP